MLNNINDDSWLPLKKSVLLSHEEEYHLAWGAKLDSFRQYLADDKAITPEQYKNGLEILSHFPPSGNKSCWELAEYIMASLHKHYHAASDDEKKQIKWLALSLYKSKFGQTHKKELDRLTNNQAEAYSADLDNIIQTAVETSMEREPDARSISSLMNATVNRRILSLVRDQYQPIHAETININPTEYTIEDTPAIKPKKCDQLIELNDPIAVMIAKQDRQQIERILGIVQRFKDTDQAVELIKPYFLESLMGVEQTQKEIAEKLDLPERKVRHIFTKIYEHIASELGVTKQQHTEKTRLEKLVEIPKSYFSDDDNSAPHKKEQISERHRKVLKACHDLSEQGKPITSISVATKIYEREPTKTDIANVNSAAKEILDKYRKVTTGARRISPRIRAEQLCDIPITDDATFSEQQRELITIARGIKAEGRPVTADNIAERLGTHGVSWINEHVRSIISQSYSRARSS